MSYSKLVSGYILIPRKKIKCLIVYGNKYFQYFRDLDAYLTQQGFSSAMKIIILSRIPQVEVDDMRKLLKKFKLEEEKVEALIDGSYVEKKRKK